MDSSDNVASYVPLTPSEHFRRYSGAVNLLEHGPPTTLPDVLTVVGEQAEVYAGITADLNGWQPILDSLVGATVGSGLLGAPIASAFERPDVPYSHNYDVEFPPDSDAAREVARTVHQDIIDGSLINSTSNMPLPGKKTQRSSPLELTTNAKNKKAKIRRTPNGANKTIAAQTVSTAQVYYDSHLLMPGGAEKRLTRLNLKLGKQLYPDVFTPFLQNLCGKGIIRMQFAGRCVSTKDKQERHNHVQMFRHRLSEGSGYNLNANVTNNWPTQFRNHILTPGASQSFFPSGDTSIPSALSAGETPWRDITTNECYWAPYNLADLEDCSWNLNALKLIPSPNGSAAAPAPFADQALTFLSANHFRSSYLALNNKIATSLGAQPSQYRYKACINKGSVCYDFMNKGTGGAKVEVLVYRLKKNANLNWTPPTDVGAPMNFVNLAISVPIGVGYLETCQDKAGTDNLGGRTPSSYDVLSNPQFPFLPLLKKTLQKNQPFVEISRQTFAMPSGSRREFNLELPGICYDPTNQLNSGPDPNAGTPSVFDEYSYAIFISCSGVACTNEMQTPTAAPIGYNVGDMISRCDIQFYCTYTEHIGACLYKYENKPIMYSAGTLTDNAVAPTQTGIKYAPTTLLEQGSAVRLPGTGGITTPGAGTKLLNDFNTA